MRMTPDPEECVRCTVSGCSCDRFKPGSVRSRSCDLCGHGWVAHALAKLQARSPSSCGPVEVALPGLVLDLSSLVLYGAQAVPVRLKILLDRLYSILSPEQVGHILCILGWSLGDYVRGYMLQYPSGKVLDRWLMVTPEEELLVLQQFFRFGETRPIVELMTRQAVRHLSDPEPKPATNGGALATWRNSRRDSRLADGVRRIEKNRPDDHDGHFEHVPGGLSLLLPFHFPSSAFHCLAPPTKEPPPPGQLTRCLQRPSGIKLTERHEREGGRGGQQNDWTPREEPAVKKIKTDPDKPSPPRLPWFHNDQDLDLLVGRARQENPPSLYPPISSSSSSPVKVSQKLPGSVHPLPSFSSSFLCPPPTASFSSSLRPLPSSLCSLPSPPPPAGGRKGRVCCGVCGKSFYDKGTLKIHYNAVHLKIKHRCTVAGCTTVFSSLRSRNRHSANPNPRLHTGAGRERNSDAHTRDAEHEHQNVRRQRADDARPPRHAGRNDANRQHGQHNAPPRPGSPPSPRTLSQDVDPHPPPPLPPPLLLSRHTSQAPSGPAPALGADGQSVSHDRGVTEGKGGDRRWRRESGDPGPKKKPRKSSTPVKIEREATETRRDEEC
ncbi:zinc finger protein basonuclin-2-like [Brachyistius frenatus]|uniref:zinc finger protein basonuclin-2-like n=1 Tax=Brachyistius frenatus TaxID=100188 RepID=UPI0037E91B42